MPHPHPHPVYAALLVLALLPLGTRAAPTDASVRVEISSLRNTRGDVGCLLFNAPEGYPETHAKAYGELHVAIDTDHAVCEFKGVAPGTYAVIAMHDENQNGKLDKNFLGVPSEGYAASNNVRPLLSAPEFKAASFFVPAAALTTIKVQIRY